MLAQLEKPTNDFLALARYLIHGDARPTPPERVAWIATQNLATQDPELAAKIMAATAALSKRCTHACLHTIIAWHPDEQPTPEAMQEIAFKTLSLAGLAGHQALAMGHGDKAHPHLHLMINRVHPETGRAWSDSHSHRRFDAIMRELSEEYGFRYVPAHSFNADLTDDLPKKPNSGATYAARRGAGTNRNQWSRRQARLFSGRISERLDAASTWDDLTQLFAGEGLALEVKGKGYVVGNATSYVKLSSLRLQRTAKGFQKRRQPAQRVTSSRPIVDAVDIARGLALFGLADAAAVQSAVQDAQGQRLASLARKPLIDQLLADLWKTFAAWTAHTPQKSDPSGKTICAPARPSSQAKGQRSRALTPRRQQRNLRTSAVRPPTPVEGP